jgi:hypothetical protein
MKTQIVHILAKMGARDRKHLAHRSPPTTLPIAPQSSARGAATRSPEASGAIYS